LVMHAFVHCDQQHFRNTAAHNGVGFFSLRHACMYCRVVCGDEGVLTRLYCQTPIA
jgi:hypothetical protein